MAKEFQLQVGEKTYTTAYVFVDEKGKVLGKVDRDSETSWRDQVLELILAASKAAKTDSKKKNK